MIIDVNHNVLIVPTINFTLKVSKDIPVGTVIIIITAVVPDVGGNR